VAIRVLVVDDDPWILRMVTATLEKRGFVVDTAREGRAALGKITQAPPDVLITDVMMPVMDGWTLVEQVRRIPGLDALPVIFLTALGKDEGRLRALGLPSDSYLAKPFRFEELEKRVAAALQRGTESAAQSSGAWAVPGSGVHAPPSPGQPPAPPSSQSGVYTAPPGQASGVYPMPPPNPASGVYPMPAPTHTSGAHPMPAPYPAYPGYPYPGYPPQQAYPQPGYPGYPYPAYPPPQAPPAGPPVPQPAPHPAASAPAPARPTPAPGGPPSLDEEPPPGTRPTRELKRMPTGEHASLGPRHTTALNGKLEQLGLSSLLVMMEMERKDGVLSLKNGEGGIVGRIFLRAGQVVSAKLDGLKALGGRECVYEMLSWTSGTFSFSATKVDMQDTVNSSTTHLLMEGARLIDEANRDEGL
jgi:CheY-like chemotaxis protein